MALQEKREIAANYRSTSKKSKHFIFILLKIYSH